MKGYRNLALAFGYIILCGVYAWIAGPEHIGELGNVLGAIGLSVAGIITGRGVNKWAEAKNGGVQ